MTNASYPRRHDGVQAMIFERQTALNLSDAEVAAAIGYDNGRVIGLIKAGTMNLPINKVIALAKVLHIDSFDLLRLVLTETAPELWNVVREVMAPLGALQPAEVNLLRHLRALCAGRVAKPIVFDGKGVVALVAVE